MRKPVLGAVGILAAGLVVPSIAVGAPSDGDQPTPAQQTSLDAGILVSPKDAVSTKSTGAANPFIALTPEVSEQDYLGWKQQLRAQADDRLANKAFKSSRAAANDQPPFVHDEEEPAGVAGSNDSAVNAEPIPGFGTAASKNNRVRILGELAELDGPGAPTAFTTEEDNGSIDLATPTGIEGVGAAATTSTLGDGPHGSAGTATNDFDVYSVDVPAGLTLAATTEGSPAATDTVIAVYDANGEVVASNDDAAFGQLYSRVSFTPDADGTFYVLVAGYSTAGSLPEDPFDSGSGAGGGDEGGYEFEASVTEFDADYYNVRLRPGDVIGGVANGASDFLQVTKPDGTKMVGAQGLDASSLYPPTSPLPGGGNTTLAYVAEEAGWYAVRVGGPAAGEYEVTVEGYRPGTQGDSSRRQTVLLDFKGGNVNTATWGGPGVRRLSPFSAFIAQWGIPRSQERRLENRITNTVRANIQREIEAAGLNPAVNVDVVTTRTHPELIGKENVSRVYVAGTIAESGISTIGIAQYIDPGNYGHEDEAIVLLDVLSAPAGPISSLNTFMNASSDRVAFVSQAVSNVVAHEIGHTIGNYHTDFSNDVHNIMDSGGGFFAENLYGVGPDFVGGTADDENIRFRTDVYSPAEGFENLENTTNVTAWAYAGR